MKFIELWSKITNVGGIKMDVWTIIPILLYVSKSRIGAPNKTTGATLYTLHITPWFAISVVNRF